MSKKQAKPHTHSIQLLRYGDRPGHVHPYSTPTTVNDGHRHLVNGTTSPPYGNPDRHVHYYEGTTTFEDGHIHSFRGWTGPPVPVSDGSHYHEFRGETSYNDGHLHHYRGVTARAEV